MVEEKDDQVRRLTAVSTNDVSVRKFQDDYTHAITPLRIVAHSRERAWYTMTSARYGDVVIATVANSAMDFAAERSDREDIDMGLVVDVVLAGRYGYSQGGRLSLVAAGEAMTTYTPMAFSCNAVDHAAVESRTIVLPERVLLGIGDISRFAGLRLTAELPEMRLLPGYLAGLDASGAIPDRELTAIVGRHVTELVIAALARAMRREDPTEGRGARAARLAAVKRIIAEQLAQPTLNAVRVARQLGVTERYVQLLMEESGTTFSAYVMEKRLQVARQSLGLNHDGMSIRDIAWASGFSDASHFTRAFRRRFGETPKAVRGGGAVEAAE